MSLAPGYGETPIHDDEFDALQPSVRQVLGDPITKAAVYDLEQAVQAESAEEMLTRVLDATLPVEDLMPTISSASFTGASTATSGPGRVPFADAK